jgi:hypothetical protein
MAGIALSLLGNEWHSPRLCLSCHREGLFSITKRQVGMIDIRYSTISKAYSFTSTRETHHSNHALRYSYAIAIPAKDARFFLPKPTTTGSLRHKNSRIILKMGRVCESNG